MAEREEIGETQLLASLLGVAEMVSSVSETDELMALIARVTPGLVRVDRCAIMAYDESTREFHTIGAFAPGEPRTLFDGLRNVVTRPSSSSHRICRLLGMSLHRRYRPWLFHAGPSAQSAPVQRRLIDVFA